MHHIAAMDLVCTSLAFIDGVGAPEMMLIFVIVLVLFGGQKLPEFARGLGKTMREFKKAAAGVEEEFKRALDEDERKTNAAQLAAASTPQLLPASETPVHDEHGYGAEPGPAATADTASATATAVPSAETAASSVSGDTAAVPTTAADIAPATPPLPGTPDPSSPPPPSHTPPPPPAPKRAQPNPAQLPDYL